MKRAATQKEVKNKINKKVETNKEGEKDEAPSDEINVVPKNLLASGKRCRRQFDPHAWENSIPTKYEHVLCLGMSYPCVKTQLHCEKRRGGTKLIQPLESVEQAVELVRRNILTEMDGRDLARCLALESSNKYLAYTISLCSSAKYSRRHLSLNFNRSNFARELKKVWGPKLRFKQIILDYFWIPSGSWMINHWAKSFFDTTLPSFVTQQLLLPDVGVVYLPFCLYVVGQLVAARKSLAKYYSISFLYKDQLDEHVLWSATSQISPAVMQNWFGKAINQEDVYCTLPASEINTATDFDNFRKSDVLNVLRGIEDFENVRMIKLKVLETQYRSSHKPPPGTLYVPGFQGLMKHDLVKRGLDHTLGGKLYNKKSSSVTAAPTHSTSSQEKSFPDTVGPAQPTSSSSHKKCSTDTPVPAQCISFSTSRKSSEHTPNPIRCISSSSQKCSKDTAHYSPISIGRKYRGRPKASTNKKHSIATKPPSTPFSHSITLAPDEITIPSKHSLESQSSITTSDFDLEIAKLHKKVKNPDNAALRHVYTFLNKKIGYRRAPKCNLLARAAADDYNQRLDVP